MSTVDTRRDPKDTRGRDPSSRDLRVLDKVRAIFTSMTKYISARAIYASSNPNLNNFANAFHQAFRAYFEVEKELLLTIEQYQIKWRDELVYDNDQKNESIAFMLYKDGVGEIIFQSSVTPAELEKFVDLIRTEIYTPSAHLDIVGRLWQSDFGNIFYRVFDESAEGASGDGRGSGTDAREQPLQVNDHPGLPISGVDSPGNNASADPSIESLGTYFYRIVEHMHPRATTHEREERLQELLDLHFVLSSDELHTWRESCCAVGDRNKLLWLLDIMLDFTRKRSPPAVVRDILDIIDRLVRYIVEERHISTLIALLDIQGKIARSDTIAIDFQGLPDRIKDELTNSAFLISLGKITPRSNDDVLQVLRYFHQVGKEAVPGVCELLANLKDPSMHEQACDTLIAIAGADVLRIVEDLNLDNPHEAKDAVYLLRRFMTNEVPPLIKKLLSSQDIQVREQAIQYLALAGGEEAAQLLCECLEDGDTNIRIKTLAAVEEFKHPLIVDKVTKLCFSGDFAARSGDELERMFRAVGRLAGESALAPLEQMTKTKAWLPFGKTQGKHKKLLAVTALRHIAGERAANMLTELADDGDGLVRTKASYALRQRKATHNASLETGTPVGPEKAEQ